MTIGLHWSYDFITGYGNLEPFWPISSREFALRAFRENWVDAEPRDGKRDGAGAGG